jgi:hypothetical protein
LGIQEIYLGCGRSAGDGRVSVSSQGDVPISAWLSRDGEGWRYSAGGRFRLRLIFAGHGGEKAGSATIVCGTSRFPFAIDLKQSGGGKICGECDLPAANDAQLMLGQ